MASIMDKLRRTFGRNLSGKDGYVIADADFGGKNYSAIAGNAGLLIPSREISRRSAVVTYAIGTMDAEISDVYLDADLQRKASRAFFDYIEKNPVANVTPAPAPDVLSERYQNLAKMYKAAYDKVFRIALPDLDFTKQSEVRSQADLLTFYSQLAIDISQMEAGLGKVPEYVGVFGGQSEYKKYSDTILTGSNFLGIISAAATPLPADIRDPKKRHDLLDKVLKKYLFEMIAPKLRCMRVSDFASTFDVNNLTKITSFMLPFLDKELDTEQMIDYFEGKCEFPIKKEADRYIESLNIGIEAISPDSLIRKKQSEKKMTFVQDSKEMLAVETALDELNQLLDEEVSQKGLQAVLKAQKKLMKCCDDFMQITSSKASGKVKKQLGTVKAIYEMVAGESYRDISIVDAGAKKLKWKDAISEARVRHIDVTGKGTVHIGSVGDTRVLIPVEGERREIYTPDSTYFGAVDDASKVMDTVYGYLFSVKEPALMKFDKQELSSVFTAGAPLKKSAIELMNDFFANRTGYTEQDRRDVCALFEKMGNAYYYKAAGKGKIEPGVELGCRNVANSRLADLIGYPELVAKATMVKVKDGHIETQGTSMRYAKGIDIRQRSMVTLLEASEVKKFDNPELTQQLLALEAMDFIAGQVDRHEGKMFYQLSEPEGMPPERKIVGIQGINSEASFGLIGPDDPALSYPLFLDSQAAEYIMGLEKETLEYMYEDILSPAAIDAAFKRVKFLKDKIANNDITVVKEWTPEIIDACATDKYVDMVTREFKSPSVLRANPHDSEEKIEETKDFAEKFAKILEAHNLGKDRYQSVYEAMKSEADLHRMGKEFKNVMKAIETVNGMLEKDATSANVADYIKARQALIDACHAYKEKNGSKHGQRVKSGLTLVDSVLKLSDEEHIEDARTVHIMGDDAGKKKCIGELLYDARTLHVDLSGVKTEVKSGNVSSRIKFPDKDGKMLYFTEESEVIKTDFYSVLEVAKTKMTPEMLAILDEEHIQKFIKYFDLEGNGFGSAGIDFGNEQDFERAMKMRDLDIKYGTDEFKAMKLIASIGETSVIYQYSYSAKPGDKTAIRNVASSRLAELLGVGNLLAKSVKAVVEKDGKTIEGIAMEAAVGCDARGDKVDDLEKLTEVGDFGNPYFMRQLSSLWALDLLAGQGDRHPGNIFYQVSDLTGNPPKRSIVGIQGIDNDQAFSPSKAKVCFEKGLKLEDLGMIDANLALNIMSIDRNTIDYTFGDVLSEQERDALFFRFTSLKDFIEKGVSKGDIKIVYDWKQPAIQELFDKHSYLKPIKDEMMCKMAAPDARKQLEARLAAKKAKEQQMAEASKEKSAPATDGMQL